MQWKKTNVYIVHKILSSIYRKIGLCIGRHPLYFVIIPILLTALSCLGLLRLNTCYDVEYLYLPNEGKSVKTRALIEKLFSSNSNDFDYSRMTRLEATTLMIVSAQNGGSMLHDSIFMELQMLESIAQNVVVIWNGRNLTYNDICKKSQGSCYENEVLNLRDKIEDIRNKKFRIKYPVGRNSTHVITYPVHFGGISTDKNNFLEDFSAIRLMYFLDDNNSTMKSIARDWERRLLETFSEVSFLHIEISLTNGILIENEMSEVFIITLPYIIICGVFMLIFAAVTCLTPDWVTSKPLVGIAGFFSALFAVVTAFCLLFICGLEYTELNCIIPFLVLGIGLDDSFVLLAAWRRTDVTDSVEKRMSDTYADVITSITITSLTNIICASIGITIPLKCIQIISIYMALSLFMDYVYQVTFYGGCLAISGYREARNLHAVLFVPVKKGEKLGLLRFMKCNGSSKESRKNKMVMSCYRDKLGKLLTSPKVKFFIMVLYILYIVGGIYFLKYLRESAKLEIAFRKNSQFMNFIRDENKYFTKYRDRIQIVIEEPLDYSNPYVQNKINELMIRLEGSPHIAESNLTESWLRMYLAFIKNPHSWFSLLGYNMSDPEDFTEALRNVFLKFKWAKSINNDIVFSEDGTKILASRFFLLTKNVDNEDKQNEIFLNVLKITQQSDLLVEAFNFRFIYFEIKPLIIPITKQSLLISFCLVILIFMIFMPNLFCATIIGFTIISIETATMGFMSLWGVLLHPLSMTILIMCIGFCTDYSAHISYAYVNSKQKTSNEKLMDALHAAGHAIIQGCLSSAIGIALMLDIPYDVFTDIFKIIFILISSSIFHGLFILPVILSTWDSFQTCLWKFLKKSCLNTMN